MASSSSLELTVVRLKAVREPKSVVMVVEPDGSYFFFNDSAFLSNPDSRIGFAGNRFDDIFVGSLSHESSYGWTGGNDQFIGQECPK